MYVHTATSICFRYSASKGNNMSSHHPIPLYRSSMLLHSSSRVNLATRHQLRSWVCLTVLMLARGGDQLVSSQQYNTVLVS